MRSKSVKTVVSRPFVFRSAALVALAISSLLTAGSLRPGARYCPHRGCNSVLLSPLSRVLNVPLPLVGIVVFAALVLVSLVPIGPVGRLRAPLSLVTGGAGLGLIAIQAFVLHTWCPLC